MALWLCGPPGVGKSAVGFCLYQEILRGGAVAAFVDARQIGFCARAVTARNLVVLWGNFRAAGAEVMVVVGSREDLAACAAVVPVIPLRLRASAETVGERIMLRGRGHGWHEPGDPLKGQPVGYLRQIIEKAIAEGESIDGAPCFETDGRTPDEIARMILHKVGGRYEQVRPGDPREP